MKLAVCVLVGALCLQAIFTSTASAQLTAIDTIQTYNPLTGAAIPYPPVGSIVTVQGTLYVVKGTFNTGANYIQGATGGIQVYNSAVTMGAIGDRIEVTGPVATFSGEIEIGSVSSYTVLDHPGEPAPIVRTVSQIAHWTGAPPKIYDYEMVGSFIRVTGTVATPPTNNTPTLDKQFSIAAGGDTLIIFVSKNTGIDVGAVAVGDRFRIDGACVKYNALLELKPRRQTDLVENPGPSIVVMPDGSGDFATIQAAMNAAAAGDTIILADGIFRGDGNRDLDPNGKSLTIRSLSGSPVDCVIDCEGSEASPHRGFFFHNLETMRISNLTVRGGYQAAEGAALQCGAALDWQHAATATVENCVFQQNSMSAAVGVGLESSCIARNTVLSDNQGIGLFAQLASCVMLDNCTFTGNTGAGAYINIGGTVGCTPGLSNCSFIDNGGDGLTLCADQLGIDPTGCTFTGNGGSGLRLISDYSYFTIANCMIADNHADGITAGTAIGLTVAGCQIARNALLGVRLSDVDGHLLSSDIVGNLGGGVLLTGLYQGTADVTGCRISDNGGVGLRVDASHLDYGSPVNGLHLARTLVCNNDSAGVQISTSQTASAHITASTVAHNGGEGLTAVDFDSLLIDHSALIGNGSDVGNVRVITQLSVGCTDIFGNSGGNWTGPLGPWSGTDGNIAADPLFCDPAASDYRLSSYSPCVSPASGACGQIGALGVGCTTPPAWKLIVQDEPNDQGGQLRFRWGHHLTDAVGQAPMATYYELQRQDAAWAVLRLVTATQADTYSVVCDTPDIFTIGQAPPARDYRLIVRTADPLTNFVSAVESAYSVDNLPPDAPLLTVYDDLTYRALAWQNPTATDFLESCLYRGTEAAFVPGSPLLCSASQYWYQETDLRRYWYKVQAADIHGNLSDWSNEVVGQYPTSIPGAQITQLRLYPNQPNPFNPRTTIRFDLPAAGPVRLAIYDLAGRMVRVLLEGEVASGRHEADWDGRDHSGRSLASGNYIARLEAGGKVETVRMTLVQ